MLSIVFKNASNVCTLNTYFKFMHFVVIHFVPNKSGATINIQTSPTAVIPMTSSASSRKLQSRSLINIHRSNQARWGATLFVYPCYLPRPGGLSGGRRGALVPLDFLKHVCNFTIVSIQMRMSRSSESFLLASLLPPKKGATERMVAK